MKNAVTWFEIPVTDLDRAVRYYEGVFGTSFHREAFNGVPMALFPYDHDKGAVGGALVENREGMKPAAEGTMVYLNAGRELEAFVARASDNGGRVVMPIKDIGDPGHIALIQDPDGNCVGLHSSR